MASLSLERAGSPRIGGALLARVVEEGSASHPWFGSDSLLLGSGALRNLADAVHFLCALHGRAPGVIEFAAERAVDPGPRDWLVSAAEAMAGERAFLAALAVAAGPVPGTPDGGATEAAVKVQRAALATLARSERRGCALGAALAFALDWSPVRTLLGFAARRLGLEEPAYRLGDPDELGLLADEAAVSPAVERALLFGAAQLAHQHRAVWDLLEARAEARRDI